MLIKVLVKPGSKKGPLVEETAEGVTVYLREKPHDGEANDALVRLLADYYDVAKSCVEIRSGGRSHQKTIEIIGK
ncbi:DUF167 domain-containing protein [Candidatus Saccharibacteria bacterium]|jgi:uncharacterized protein (TIGR00251 family)|nr:DUF167 domain-containing protein [Candidatus Saccharibacteria bacterium]